MSKIRLPYTIEVEGIGEFKFRHSTFVDQLRIEARGPPHPWGRLRR